MQSSSKSSVCHLWCFWTVVLEKTLRVPWTARRSNHSILKEISPEYSLEGLMLKMKLPILWPPDVKNWLIGKDPDAGKDWRQEEKGTTENEMVGWHHRLDGCEFEQAPGVGDRQGSLACHSPLGHRVRHDWATEPLNWTEWLRIHPDIQGWNLFCAWVISLITCLLSQVLSRSWDCLAQESIRQHPKSEEKTEQRCLQEKKCTDNESILKLLLDVQPSSGHETTTYFSSQFK